MNWRAIPLVRLLCPLVVGIIVSSQYNNLITSVGRVALIVLWLFLLVLHWKRVPYSKRWVFGCILHGYLFLVGGMLIQWNDPNNASNYIRKYLEDDSIYWGELIAKEDKPKYNKCTLKLMGLRRKNGELCSISGKIIIYLKRKANGGSLSIGRILCFAGTLKELPEPKNPLVFDYSNYLRQKQIYFSTYVGPESWKLLQSKPRFNISIWCKTIQAYFLNVLRESIIGDEEFGVAAALILGDKSHIGRRLKDAYANTGAMHVLAVSGLHVGIVYLVIRFLFPAFRRKSIGWKFLEMMVFGIAIWGFALIAGGSASVLRAAVMFTCVAIGDFFNRDKCIYNTLAASAMLLLCVFPNLIFDIGFQLSYSAVIGIVYFQSKLYRSIYFRFWGLDQLWKLITVGIAAQIGTLPITLYYFHQFPTYFWLSGTMVVPGAMLILCLGGLLFTLNSFALIQEWLGKGLNVLIHAMNKMIYMVENLPFSMISNIWIDKWILIFLYLLILSIIFLIESKKKRWVFTFLFLLLIVGGSHFFRLLRVNASRELVFYHHREKSILEYFEHGKALRFSSGLIEEKEYPFLFENYHQYKGIRKIEKTSMPLREDTLARKPIERAFFLRLGDKSCLILDAVRLGHFERSVDYVWISNSPDFQLEQISKTIKASIWIFNANNSKRQNRQYMEKCTDLGLTCWDQHESGALILKF